MKVQVIFKTVTGNTKKVAQAIFDDLKCEKDIKPITEIKDLSGFDLYFICTPIMHMGPDPQIEKFLKEKTKGKQIALVITHGSPPGFHHLDLWLKKFKEIVSEATLLGMFDCQGQLSDAAVQFFLNTKIPDLMDLAKIKNSTKGQPDASKLNNAKLFSKKIIADLTK